MLSKTNIFLKGFFDVLPLLIPVAPFGIILGVIGIELGFSPLEVRFTDFAIDNFDHSFEFEDEKGKLLKIFTP